VPVIRPNTGLVVRPGSGGHPGPDAVAAAGQQAALALMTSSCQILRPSTADPVLNKATGLTTRPAEALIYSGKCRIKPSARADRLVEGGETPVAHWRYLVSVPLAVVGVERGDWVLITACPLDGSLVGLRLLIRSIERGSQITARRLQCEEAASGHQR
jgi:hypothetical protein